MHRKALGRQKQLNFLQKKFKKKAPEVVCGPHKAIIRKKDHQHKNTKNLNSSQNVFCMYFNFFGRGLATPCATV
jgi:hypothetical protein